MQLEPMPNSSHLYPNFGMLPVNAGKNVTAPAVDANSVTSGGANVTDANRRANMAAIQDTIVDAFSGYIDAMCEY